MLTNWVHDEYPKGTIVVIRGVERQAQSASMVHVSGAILDCVDLH